ncbi:hypothetical protein C823_004309 [Eubacterium plexicaudatum ASF492]|uniref:Uncharacterized protein n=1 Tax=Eubacterium plexicaudatum ASF492 TaxID=1235802 RepID=N2AAI6_9FIRM|nr:hypothetical protein C823_004309 [Eubacterium plexicaudatum ASF492]
MKIANKTKVIHMYEDYENPKTGEYFRWITNDHTRRSDIAKEFEFKIKYSVSSSKFTVKGTSVKVESSA